MKRIVFWIGIFLLFIGLFNMFLAHFQHESLTTKEEAKDQYEHIFTGAIIVAFSLLILIKNQGARFSFKRD